MRWALTITGLAAMAVVHGAIWMLANRPADLADAETARIQSVSFSAFRWGQSPLTERFPTAEQIEADLDLLEPVVEEVRTYTSLDGMTVVPEIARRNGLRVTQSAWLGRELDRNEEDVDTLIELANAHPDVIDRVIVGNEVLLRRDLGETELRDYIRRVRGAVAQPVGYAEVWEFWLRHAALAEEVDFLVIHILPYWEDHPVGVHRAMQHVLDVYRLMERAFPDHPIYVGEIGWPSRGRMRGDARPGRVEQTRFLREFLTLAEAQGIDYNLIEAFDQPWKHRLEGTVGANWGLFTAGREPKFTLAGPVIERPHWPLEAAAAVTLGFLAGLLFLRRYPPAAPGGAVAYAAFANLLTAMLVLAASAGLAQAYSPERAIRGLANLGAQALLAVIMLRSLAKAWDAERAGAGGASPMPALRTAFSVLGDGSRFGTFTAPFRFGAARSPTRRDANLAWLGEAVYLGLVLGALWLTWWLFVDPRYRDFPVIGFLVPSLGMIAFMALRLAWTPRLPVGGFGIPALSRAFDWRHDIAGREPEPGPAYPDRLRPSVMGELLIIAACVAGAVVIVMGEGWENRQAVTWATLLVVLALPCLGTLLRSIAWLQPLPSGEKARG